MTEKVELADLQEMTTILKDIRDRLTSLPQFGVRGPVADPAPPFGVKSPWADPVPPFGVMGQAVDPSLLQYTVRGPVADPGPMLLLDKAKLAQIKIRQIDMVVMDLEKQVEFLKLERDMLKEEYRIK